MGIKKGYKFQLVPTPEQEQLCHQFVGFSRFTWNRFLNFKKELCEIKEENISEFDLNKLITKWEKDLPLLKDPLLRKNYIRAKKQLNL